MQSIILNTSVVLTTVTDNPEQAKHVGKLTQCVLNLLEGHTMW